MEKDNNNQKQLEQKIKQVLLRLGIKIHVRGFRYWTTAILYVINENIEGKDELKMGNLYVYVGKKHKATVARVEKAMRYVHEELDLQREFDVPYSITNTSFLFLVKEKVLSE